MATDWRNPPGQGGLGYPARNEFKLVGKDDNWIVVRSYPAENPQVLVELIVLEGLTFEEALEKASQIEEELRTGKRAPF